jgi:transposase
VRSLFPSGLCLIILPMHREELERWLAEGRSLEQIGSEVGRDASTVGYWVKRHGLVASNRDKHRSRGGIPKSDLEELVAAGHSQEAVATRLGVSPSTVRHWLKKHGIETRATVRLREAKAARAAGVRVSVGTCRRHGSTDFWLDSRGRYRCLRCRSEAVTRRRRKVKKTLVDEAGGACSRCGYDRYVGALHFHHVDPENKAFSLSHTGVSRALAKGREEASKCVLLCSNCHAEIEGGFMSLA